MTRCLSHAIEACAPCAISLPRRILRSRRMTMTCFVGRCPVPWCSAPSSTSGYRESNPGPHLGKVVLSPLSYNRMSPSPVPIRATRPYLGHADAGPKGVSWGSAIRTRTNSFRDYRAAWLPHSPSAPRVGPCPGGCVRSAGLEPALSTSSTWPGCRWSTSAWSRHPVPTRTAGLTRAGSQPCVTARCRAALRPARRTACGRRDSNAQAARSELARYPGSRHSRIVRHQGLEPRTVSLRGCCSDH